MGITDYVRRLFGEVTPEPSAEWRMRPLGNGRLELARYDADGNLAGEPTVYRMSYEFLYDSLESIQTR